MLNVSLMTSLIKNNETKLEPWQLEDAQRLHVLWKKRQHEPKALGQAEFGARYNLASGNPQSMVWQYLNGRRALNPKAALAFADYLSVDIGKFSPRMAKEIRGLQVSEDSGTYSGLRSRGVPVIGTAQLGKEGYWNELEHPMGQGEGRLNYESKDVNAYAVRVLGDSMVPRIRSGEYVIVEPGHPIVPGDEVLIVTTEGVSMVKEFLYERDGSLYLESVNRDHPRLVLKREIVERFHYVLGIIKSPGFLPEMG
jgi:SOS-response transcriptional repressor LexA